MDKKINSPNIIEVAGSFGHVGTYDYESYISFLDEGLPNLDCVVQSVPDFDILSQTMIPPLTLEVVGDGAAGAAGLDLTWTNAPGDPTSLAFAVAGTGGNAWSATMYDVGPVGAGNEVVVEDAVLNILYIGIDVGTSTVLDVQNAVTAAGPNIVVGTASGTPAALAAAADCFGVTPLTGGADAQSISVLGDVTRGLAYTVHFTPATTTVALFNALIGTTTYLHVPALGVGTIGAFLQAGDVLPQSILHDPNGDAQIGAGYICGRTATGVYMIVIRPGAAKSVLSIKASLSGDAAVGKFVNIGTPIVMPNVGTMFAVYVYTADTGALTDLTVANNERINFKALVKHI